MTKTAEAEELAERLNEFLEEVGAGHDVIVTREQKPIARLVPLEPLRTSPQRSIRDLTPLSGQWVGERILKSGELADDLFARE